jgi:hypothetical protein
MAFRALLMSPNTDLATALQFSELLFGPMSCDGALDVRVSKSMGVRAALQRRVRNSALR